MSQLQSIYSRIPLFSKEG